MTWNNLIETHQSPSLNNLTPFLLKSLRTRHICSERVEINCILTGPLINIMPVDSPMLIDSKQLPDQAATNGHKQGAVTNGNGASSIKRQDSSDDDDLPLVYIFRSIEYEALMPYTPLSSPKLLVLPTPRRCHLAI